jgi:hypothetical protein
MWIVHNNTCNDNCDSRKDTIIWGTHIMKWLHYSCHRDLWLFSFLFKFFFDFPYSCHYNPSSMVFFNSRYVYFLLLVTCVHKPSNMCRSLQFFNVVLCLGGSSHLFHTLESMHLLGYSICDKRHLFSLWSFILLVYYWCLDCYVLYDMCSCAFIYLVLFVDGFYPCPFIYKVFLLLCGR